MTTLIDTPHTDMRALQKIAISVRHNAPQHWVRIIEVGSWVGGSAFMMASLAADVQVHCIDTWDGSKTDVTGKIAEQFGHERLFRLFCHNCGPLLFTQIFPHVGTSAFWASLWPWKADLIYLDADHEYEAVLQDIKLWTPHVRPGGILCGHDFCDAFPGVEKAVRETGGFQRAGEAIWWRQL